MELEIYEMKIIPGEPDISGKMGQSGDYAGTVINRELEVFQVSKGWQFYYPVHPEFRGSSDDLKSLSYPGEGYIAERPWCTFNTEFNYELNMFLDLYPYTIYSEKNKL